MHLDAPGQRHGQQPRLRDSRPSKDKSSRGSVDTTKTRLDPQRVRMCSGERPIGAAKGKQPDTKALCQPAPPPPPVRATAGVVYVKFGILVLLSPGGGGWGYHDPLSWASAPGLSPPSLHREGPFRPVPCPSNSQTVLKTSSVGARGHRGPLNHSDVSDAVLCRNSGTLRRSAKNKCSHWLDAALLCLGVALLPGHL